MSADTRDAEPRQAAAHESDVEATRVIRVVVADSLRLLVSGIRRSLEHDDEIDVVGEEHSACALLTLVAETQPDVVLLGPAMTGGEGFSTLKQLRASHPAVKVVVLSTSADPERVWAALEHGASGYIVETVDPRDLPSALRQAVEATVYYAVGGLDSSRRVVRAAELTRRELAVLEAVSRGLSNQAIGKELWVTEQTVKFHLTNIYRKLGVGNRTEAARYAYQHGLVGAQGGFDRGPTGGGAALSGTATVRNRARPAGSEGGR